MTIHAWPFPHNLTCIKVRSRLAVDKQYKLQSKDKAAQVELNALELLLIPHPRQFSLIPEGNTSHLNYLAILGYGIRVRHSSQGISDGTGWG